MFRFVPPAGSPVKVGQVLGALRVSLQPGKGEEKALSEVRDRLRVRFAFGISSGRAALCLVLKALASLRPGRRVVAVPAYTCFTVAAAIVRAGHTIHPVDIDPATLDYDFDRLESVPEDGLLCILTSNLFGFVNDLARTRGIARKKRAFVVDDAAQAFGAIRNGHMSGTGGDVGIFSLGRGKALPAIEGGLIVTDSVEIAEAIQAGLAQVSGASKTHLAWVFLQMVVYSIFLRPRLYWIPNAMPFLKLGSTEFSPDFRITGLPALSSGLLTQLIESPVDASAIRRANAARISKVLSTKSAFSSPKPATDCLPTYVRFPVLARNRTMRDQVVAKLRAVGIGAGPFYPTALCDIPGIDQYMAPRDYHRPNAEQVSQSLFTLPTHHYLGKADLDRVVEVLSSF